MIRDATVCGYIAAIGVDDVGVLSAVVVNVNGKPPLPDAQLTEEQRRLHACLAFLAKSITDQKTASALFAAIYALRDVHDKLADGRDAPQPVPLARRALDDVQRLHAARAVDRATIDAWPQGRGRICDFWNSCVFGSPGRLLLRPKRKNGQK